MKHAICPILSLFLCCFFAAGDNTPNKTSVSAQNALGLTTIVIDAGHGGKDPGAVSKDQKSLEKAFTLDIAKRFAECVRQELPQIKVVLTRSTDEFIELRQRADIANKANANLFISIHINASSSTAANGYSVHILGQSSQKDRNLFAYNMDMVKRENSVIMLEDNYQVHYQGFDPTDPESFIFMQLMQNAYLEQSLLFATIVSEKLKAGPFKTDRGIDQNPFYVLWRTSMPAVLVELGFISNLSDLTTLQNEQQRQALAQRLLEALKEYKTLYDSSVNIGSPTNNASATSTAGSSAPTSSAKPEPSAPATEPATTDSAQATKPTTDSTPATEVASDSASDKSVASAIDSVNQSSAKPAKESATPADTSTANSTASTATTKPATASQSSAKPASELATIESTKPATESVVYGTQIFASSAKLEPTDKRLLGWKPTIIQGKTIYKYIVGVSTSKEIARQNYQKLKSSFPDCFMVKLIDGKTERIN